MLALQAPFLKRLITAHPDVLTADADTLFNGLCFQTNAAITMSEVDAMRHWRTLRAKVALLVALADLDGHWNLAQVTQALTRFADACVEAALAHCLLAQHKAGKLILKDPDHPTDDCGYTILAMGKQGAFELNYSSDIDLIILYDPETAPLAEGVEPSQLFVKITRKLVSLLQDVTEDGYVFRVDLRLRPDPRATQVAIAVEAAANYYESQGQNWERAAMIKARACAGDMALGEEFLARLKPYIWRKYLDFAAIADVQSLKRQIHAVKGHGEIAIRGHNLKLGRGGIREIEFFVQTQQLIAGGRNPALRGKSTVSMLHELANAKWITPEAAEELQEAYEFLRTLEHRVQMLEDRQDHCVPKDDETYERYAVFAGFENGDALSAKLRATLERVQGHYDALFAESEALGAEQGNLVFTGGEDDPDTIKTLSALGYQQSSEVSATIRGWHFGRYAATRSAKSREILTELMPQLLQALAATGDADQAFLGFDRFLQGLPAGLQLFSMLKANPHLLGLISNILGTAPRLARQLSARPRTLEAFLDPAFFGPMPTRADIDQMVASIIPTTLPLEEAMDRARELGRELMFGVGVRVLSETVTAAEAGEGFSTVADALIARLHQAVTQDMERQHGKIAGGASAVVALGKLGGREMTAGSDLDLMLIYDHNGEQSDGARPLAAAPYYTKLTQRLVAALSAPTAEGTLYEVDMRLRPSGSKGPVAVSMAAFIDYQRDSAWTWEKMALTRARVITAPQALRGRIDNAVRATLTAQRDREAVVQDVTQMRGMMLREHNPKSTWDIKRVRGGLVEVEFIAQTLQLIHAHDHPVLSPNTHLAIQQLAEAGDLSAADAETLLAANTLYHRLTQVLRLCADGDFDPERAVPGLNQSLTKAAQLPDIMTLSAYLADKQSAVVKLFDTLIGKPK